MSPLLAIASKRCFQRVDLHHLFAEAQRSAQPLEQAGHALCQLVGAAPRPPDPAVLFQLVDQGVDRAGGHRVAAHQQGVERERLAQVLVLHIVADHRIDRAPRLVAGQRRGGLHHAGEIEEGLVPQLDVAFLVDPGGVAHEFVVACRIPRGDASDLAAQGHFVVRIVEGDAVGPIEPVERHDRHQVDVVRHVLRGERPQFAQGIGIGDDGGAGVEGKALALPDVGAAAHFVARFHQRGLDAGRLQPDSKGETAEAGADDTGLLHRLRLSVAGARSASG